MTPVFSAIVCAAALIAATAAQAAGQVQVRWINPEQFSDIGRSAIDRERTMKLLDEHLQRLGRQLPDGQTLLIEMLDLDLAGEIEPLGWQPLRVLRGRADWPRLTLRYTLQAAGATLKTGEARLAEMNYLAAPRLAASHLGELAYEKQMVNRWFKDTFAPH